MEAIIHFVAELAKDPKRVPMIIHLERVYTMDGINRELSPSVFSASTTSESFCCPSRKVLQLAQKYGSDLTSLECSNVKFQLPDKETVIGIMQGKHSGI